MMNIFIYYTKINISLSLNSNSKVSKEMLTKIPHKIVDEFDLLLCQRFRVASALGPSRNHGLHGFVSGKHAQVKIFKCQ